MLAVSNTSPISNLAIIGRLDLMKSQFPVVWIPTAVGDKLAANPDPAALDPKRCADGIQSLPTQVYNLWDL